MNTHKIFGDGITDAESRKYSLLFKDTRYFIYACSLNFTKNTVGSDLVYVSISFKDGIENVVLDNLPFNCHSDYAHFIWIISNATSLDIVKDFTSIHNGLCCVLFDIDIDDNGRVSKSMRTREFNFAFTL